MAALADRRGWVRFDAASPTSSRFTVTIPGAIPNREVDLWLNSREEFFRSLLGGNDCERTAKRTQTAI
jgi:hypothetical protein